jgi:hypothetical protein
VAPAAAILLAIACTAATPAHADAAPSHGPGAAPQPPRGLRAVVTAQSIRVSWRRGHERDVHHYSVFRRVHSAATWPRRAAYAKVTRLRIVDHRVEPGTTYDYRVKAVDDRGHASAPTAAVTVRLGAGTAAAVTTLTPARAATPGAGAPGVPAPVDATPAPDPGSPGPGGTPGGGVFSSGPHTPVPAGHVYAPNTSCNTGTNITLSSSGECYSLLGPTNGTTPSAANRTPVLVIFHGAVPTDTTASHASTWGRIVTSARARGWQVAIPLPAYNEPELVPFLTRMVSDLTTSRFADVDRINLVGFSAGGYLAMMATCAQRAMFNSVAALAGSIPGDGRIGAATYFPCTASSSHPSLLILTGEQDQPNYSGCLTSGTGACDTDASGTTVWDPYTLAMDPLSQAPTPRSGEVVNYFGDLHITAAWAAWNSCATHTFQPDGSAAAPTAPATPSPLGAGQASRHTWSACATSNRAGRPSEVALDSMLGGNHMSAFTNATLDESWAFIARQN